MREIWTHTKAHDRETIASCKLKHKHRCLIFNKLHNLKIGFLGNISSSKLRK